MGIIQGFDGHETYTTVRYSEVQRYEGNDICFSKLCHAFLWFQRVRQVFVPLWCTELQVWRTQEAPMLFIFHLELHVLCGREVVGSLAWKDAWQNFFTWTDVYVTNWEPFHLLRESWRTQGLRGQVQTELEHHSKRSKTLVKMAEYSSTLYLRSFEYEING